MAGGGGGGGGAAGVLHEKLSIFIIDTKSTKDIKSSMGSYGCCNKCDTHNTSLNNKHVPYSIGQD